MYKRQIEAVRGEPVKQKDFRTQLKAAMVLLDMDRSFLSRYVNDGFSGGEKKRLEILQLVLLQPSLAILDETDSGLDIDALKIVSKGINQVVPQAGCIVITHYQRLLEHVKADCVHVMIDGKIVKSGGPDLAHKLEDQGYDWLEVDA